MSARTERALNQGRQCRAGLTQIGELVDDNKALGHRLEQSLEGLVPVGERIPATAGPAGQRPAKAGQRLGLGGIGSAGRWAVVPARAGTVAPSTPENQDTQPGARRTTDNSRTITPTGTATP